MQLEILSNLRNFQTEIIKQLKLNTMSIAYDVRTDLRYLQGKEETQKEIIMSLLEDGLLPIKDIAKVAKVSVEYVLDIQKNMKTKKP
jgi:predicted transcriptional regulator